MSQSKIAGNSTTTRKPSDRKVKDQNPLDLVVITVDPKLDNLESRNVLSDKAVEAKRMFSNYRKNH